MFTRTRLQQARTAHTLARLGFSWTEAVMGVLRSEWSTRRGWLLILPHCPPSFLPHSLIHFMEKKTLSRFFDATCLSRDTLFRAALLVSTSLCVKPSVALEQLAFLEIQYRRERLRNSDSPCCVCNTPVHVTREHMIGRFNELYVTMPFA